LKNLEFSKILAITLQLAQIHKIMVESKLTSKQAETIWKLAYNLNTSIKTYMDSVYEDKNGIITDKEINDLENYKINSWNNIIRSVILN
jgi:hypothetical protein